MIVPAGRFTRQWRSLHPQEPHTGVAPSGHLVRTGAFCALLFALAGCFETEYGPLLAGRPHYELVYLEESYDAVCAIPSTAVIDTSLEPHSEHRRNALDYSTDEEGHEVVRNHAHTAYGLSDFHAERRPDYDDERGEAWLTFIHGEHVQVPPEGEDFWIAYRSGADCHPDNNLMLFPYAVNPEPPQLRLVAVPFVVDGVRSDMSDLFRRVFYTSILEVFPLAEISMRTDPELEIIVPADSSALDLEAGTIDMLQLGDEYRWTPGASNISLNAYWTEHQRDGEIFLGYIDGQDPEWVERFGEQGLWAPYITGGPGSATLSIAIADYQIPDYIFDSTNTHEIGHALGLGHAPCEGTPGPDPDFPHPDGNVGDAVAWSETRNDANGWWRLGPLVSSEAGYSDIMGYCEPAFISPYYFNQAAEFFADWQGNWEFWEVRPDSYATEGGPSLALSGFVGDDGVPVVTHAAVSAEAPFPDSLGGTYRIEAFSEHGVVVACGTADPYLRYAEDGSEPIANWSARLPMPESVSGVRVVGVDGFELSSAHLEVQGEAVRLISR